jgi:hypothetical protein
MTRRTTKRRKPRPSKRRADDLARLVTHLVEQLGQGRAVSLKRRGAAKLVVTFSVPMRMPSSAGRQLLADAGSEESFKAFAGQCIARSRGDRVQSSVALAVYNAWARATGNHERTARGFAAGMARRGLKKTKSNAAFWLDVRLIKAVGDFVTPTSTAAASPAALPRHGVRRHVR